MEKKDNDRTNFEEEEEKELLTPFEAEEENRFGRFKNADALYNSYLKLEAEFTRRSQQLKRLRNICAEHGLGEDGQPLATHGVAEKEIAGEANGLADGSTGVAEGKVPDKSAEKAVEKTVEKEAEKTAEKATDESAISDDVKEKIIKEYLDGVAKSNVPLLKGGGGIVTAGKRRISSITQAGNLSLQYFREGNK